MEQGTRGMNLDGLVVNRYSKMCFPVGVKMINEEIFNPIEKKKKVQHYTCRDIISDINSEALFADGFDDAIVGYDAVGFRVVYDYDKCSDILMKRDGMTEHEAHEFMEFNVVSAFVGEFTPLFINKI